MLLTLSRRSETKQGHYDTGVSTSHHVHVHCIGTAANSYLVKARTDHNWSLVHKVLAFNYTHPACVVARTSSSKSKHKTVYLLRGFPIQRVRVLLISYKDIQIISTHFTVIGIHKDTYSVYH